MEMTVFVMKNGLIVHTEQLLYNNANHIDTARKRINELRLQYQTSQIFCYWNNNWYKAVFLYNSTGISVKKTRLVIAPNPNSEIPKLLQMVVLVGAI